MKAGGRKAAGISLMNDTADSNGVSIGIIIIAPRGGAVKFYPPQMGLVRRRRIIPQRYT